MFDISSRWLVFPSSETQDSFSVSTAVQIFVRDPYTKAIICCKLLKVCPGLDKYIYPDLVAVLLNIDLGFYPSLSSLAPLKYGSRILSFFKFSGTALKDKISLINL